MTDINYLRAIFYPLGILASATFGIRCFAQWYQSEKKKQSITNPLFWRLSITANSLLAIHSIIQLQFWIALVQSLHFILSWRNLNFFKPKEKQASFSTVVVLLIITALSVLAIFIAQGLFLSEGIIEWMRVPQSFGPETEAAQVSLVVHTIGVIGICSYSLRFWIQWLQSEYKHKSELTSTFWQLSLLGATLSGLYFIRIFDWVNAVGTTLAIIPYIRNLYLIKNRQPKQAPDSSTLFLFAGEISADSYGAHIVRSLRNNHPQYTLIGIGGPEMAKAGFKSMVPFSFFQVMGFFDVCKRFFLLLYAKTRIVHKICKENPKITLFIDSPAFSLHIAQSLRKKGYSGKLVQCVAPTVWAWKKKRAEKLAALFDHLFCIFPFEPQYFSHLMSCSFIGHPILESIESTKSEPLITQRLNKPLIAIFPGSRPKEIERNLPKQFEAVAKIAKSGLDISVGCVMSPSADPWHMKKTIESIKKKYGSDICVELVPFSRRYALMQESMCAIAKSGTVTLELALHQVPTVVTYALSWIDFQIAKYLKLDLRFYCIVNILAGKELFKELIKPPVTINDISHELEALIGDEERRLLCKRECAELKELLCKEEKPSQRIIEELLTL